MGKRSKQWWIGFYATIGVMSVITTLLFVAIFLGECS